MKILIYYAISTRRNKAAVLAPVTGDWSTNPLSDVKTEFLKSCNKYSSLRVFKTSCSMRYCLVEANKPSEAKQIVEDALSVLGYSIVNKHKPVTK